MLVAELNVSFSPASVSVTKKAGCVIAKVTNIKIDDISCYCGSQLSILPRLVQST